MLHLLADNIRIPRADFFIRLAIFYKNGWQCFYYYGYLFRISVSCRFIHQRSVYHAFSPQFLILVYLPYTRANEKLIDERLASPVSSLARRTFIVCTLLLTGIENAAAVAAKVKIIATKSSIEH
jgi:hypothetical protein